MFSAKCGCLQWGSVQNILGTLEKNWALLHYYCAQLDIRRDTGHGFTGWWLMQPKRLEWRMVHHDVSDQTVKLKKHTRMRYVQLSSNFWNSGNHNNRNAQRIEDGYIGGAKMRNVTYVGLELHLSITCLCKQPYPSLMSAYQRLVYLVTVSEYFRDTPLSSPFLCGTTSEMGTFLETHEIYSMSIIFCMLQRPVFY